MHGADCWWTESATLEGLADDLKELMKQVELDKTVSLRLERV
jgi:hypothetical protein